MLLVLFVEKMKFLILYCSPLSPSIQFSVMVELYPRVNSGSDVVLNCRGGASAGLMVQSKQFGGVCSVAGSLRLDVDG